MLTRAKSTLQTVSILTAVVVLSLPLEVRAADVKAGEEIFKRECLVCHGEKGLADGPATPLLDPRARNFDQGLFKIRTTPTGELPTDADIIRTIKRGLPGSGMPSFEYLGDEVIANVVAFVKTLGGPEGEEGSWFDLYEVPEPQVVPMPPPPVTEASKARGVELFDKMGCIGCHNKTGTGDAKPRSETIDNWGYEISPRNFTLGVFKGGHEPQDLYMRVLTGLDGTPMTAFWKDVMSVEERWAVVQHEIAFGPPRDIKQPGREAVTVASGAAPATIEDAAWGSAEAAKITRMALRGGWRKYFDPLDVRVAADGDDLALLVSWDDGANTCPSLRVTFPQAGEPAGFQIGTEEAPVRVWTWKEGEGAKILEATGIKAEGDETEKEKVLEGELTAVAKKEGTKHTLLLKGAAPAARDRILLTLATCTAEQDYTSGSTFFDLK